MDIKILKNTKEELEAEFGSITIAEILRVYLNKNASVTFAAWKREHPTKNPLLKVQTKGKTAKKAVDEAVVAITKDLNKIEAEFKKLK